MTQVVGELCQAFICSFEFKFLWSVKSCSFGTISSNRVRFKDSPS